MAFEFFKAVPPLSCSLTWTNYKSVKRYGGKLGALAVHHKKGSLGKKSMKPDELGLFQAQNDSTAYLRYMIDTPISTRDGTLPVRTRQTCRVPNPPTQGARFRMRRVRYNGYASNCLEESRTLNVLQWNAKAI